MLSPQGMFEDLGLKYVGPVDGHESSRWSRRCAGPATSAGRSSCTPSPRRASATSRPRRPDRRLARHRRLRPRHRPSAGRPRLDGRLLRRARRSAPSGPTSSRSPPRCCSRSGWPLRRAVPRTDLRRRHRRAARGDLGRGPGDGRAAPGRRALLDVPQPRVRPVLMDVALHKQPVTFVLDRAGVTGDDGASHNGMWDMSSARRPRPAARRTRDEATRCASCCASPRGLRGPTACVTPRVPPVDIPPLERLGPVEVLLRGGERGRAAGRHRSHGAGLGVEVSERFIAQGIGITVVDPPVDHAGGPVETYDTAGRSACGWS